MSRSLSLTLVIVGVVLIVIAAIEHFALRVTMLPHLAIYLGVIAVIVLGIGAYGMMSRAKVQG